MPSDSALQNLFSDDPVKKTVYRDMKTEAGLLLQYYGWCESKVINDTDPARAEF